MISTEQPLPAMVSVVIAARDAEGTIETALRSLQAQTYQRWEAVVVDDGSVDGTAAVIQRLAQHDPRVRLFQGSGAGVSAARNLALTRARAEWVSFLDADDWLLPAGLETLCAVLDADLGPDVVVAAWRRVSSEGEELAVDLPHVQGAMFEELARRPVFPIHACIARRSLIQALGFDPELPVCTDLGPLAAGAARAPNSA